MPENFDHDGEEEKLGAPKSDMGKIAVLVVLLVGLVVAGVMAVRKYQALQPPAPPGPIPAAVDSGQMKKDIQKAATRAMLENPKAMGELMKARNKATSPTLSKPQ